MRSFFVKILGASFLTGGAAGLVESFSFAFWSNAKYPLGFEAGAAAVDALVAVRGFVAGEAVLGGAVDALTDTTGFLSMGLADLTDAGAAVPRYGTVEVAAGGLGLAAAGAVGRAEPFVGAGWLGLSFRCILACMPSPGPDALRLSCGAWVAPFAPPAGRGAGFGVAAGCGGLEAAGLAPPGPTMDMISRKAYTWNQGRVRRRWVQHTHAHGRRLESVDSALPVVSVGQVVHASQQEKSGW